MSDAATAPEKTNIQLIKEFFAPIENSELLSLRKADPESLKQLGEGIRNGSLTY
jgi:hypothetical protein